MYTIPPKKLLIINILDILKKHSDENHRLSQKEIVDILKSEYSMVVERKAVKRNLMNLIDYGYNIEYNEHLRMVPNKATGELEANYILSDFYLARDFTDSELRLLIDSLLFSRHIPHKQRMELIGKLESLSNQYFQSRIKHIRTLRNHSAQSGQLFYTIEVLDEAISKGKKVAFIYTEYGTDKKLHPRKSNDGTVRKYIVNPYQIAATNGQYYLICNYDKYDNVAHYRLDRIRDIEILDTSRKPAKQVKGLEHGLDLPKHMAEHLYMFAGESGVVSFRIKKYILNDVIDWFGEEITFFNETTDEVSVRVSVNYEAMRRWAMQYALHAKILSPESLAKQVQTDLKSAMANYDGA